MPPLNTAIPPAIALMLNELPDTLSPKIARKKLRALFPDLTTQSEVYLDLDDSSGDVPHANSRFSLHMHGALDFFTRDGCIALPCRAKAVDRLSRSVGLIADEIWITDTLSPMFADTDKISNEVLDYVTDEIFVLNRLRPLIEAGIIRFSPSRLAYCDSCLSNLELEIDNITEELIPIFDRDITLEKDKTMGLIINTGKCFDPPLIRSFTSNKTQEIKRNKITKKILVEEVRSALWVARNASISTGSVVSNSRVALAGMLRSDGRLVERQALFQMEKEREILVPWVSSLSPTQIVQLRQEASDALPLFRIAMANALAFSGDSEATDTKTRELISHLRAQAEEVRIELDVTKRNSARYWKTTFNLLGLGISTYGIATDQIALGFAGLLPLIQLLVEHKSGHNTDIDLLKHRPGYVLLKAEQLLEHAD